MKYKVGDEVLVKARIHYIVNQETELPYEVKERNNGKIAPRTIWVKEEDIQPEPTMTAEEAWELAMKIEAMRSDALLKIFDMDSVYCILQDFTPMQAKAKIEAREAEKEINVGDVIYLTYNQSNNGVVTNIYGKDEKKMYVLWDDGSSGVLTYTKSIKKTGRHIDIEGLLRNIEGDK